MKASNALPSQVRSSRGTTLIMPDGLGGWTSALGRADRRPPAAEARRDRRHRYIHADHPFALASDAGEPAISVAVRNRGAADLVGLRVNRLFGCIALACLILSCVDADESVDRRRESPPPSAAAVTEESRGCETFVLYLVNEAAIDGEVITVDVVVDDDEPASFVLGPAGADEQICLGHLPDGEHQLRVAAGRAALARRIDVGQRDTWWVVQYVRQNGAPNLIFKEIFDEQPGFG